MAQTETKGGCSHCEGSVPLAPDGLLMYHGDRNTFQGDCLGSRELPVTREEREMNDIETEALSEHRYAVAAKLVDRAVTAEVALTVNDINWIGDHPIIDGMPADEWLDAMTMD